MQILLPWQEHHLSLWEDRKVQALAPRQKIPSPFHDLRRATLAVEDEGPPAEDGPFARVEASVLSYRVFGPRLGIPAVRREPLKTGDVIGLRYNFWGPIDMFFASRVVEVFEREEVEDGWRSGFSYQTLEGHPETGEEIFEVKKLRSGEVVFRIEAWSRPRLWYVRLVTPWARYIQKQAARSAVDYLTHIAGVD